MKRKNLNLLLIAIPMSTLAACGSSGDSGSTPPSPPPPTTVSAQEDSFGVAFGTAFRADPNAPPIEPKDGDVIPTSLTDPPIEIK